jgi:hypothetical protein
MISMLTRVKTVRLTAIRRKGLSFVNVARTIFNIPHLEQLLARIAQLDLILRGTIQEHAYPVRLVPPLHIPRTQAYLVKLAAKEVSPVVEQLSVRTAKLELTLTIQTTHVNPVRITPTRMRRRTNVENAAMDRYLMIHHRAALIVRLEKWRLTSTSVSPAPLAFTLLHDQSNVHTAR